MKENIISVKWKKEKKYDCPLNIHSVIIIITKISVQNNDL